MSDFRADHARCIPVLASLNIDEYHDFYVSTLGFTAVIYREHNYLIVRRDEMEFHFWLAEDRKDLSLRIDRLRLQVQLYEVQQRLSQDEEEEMVMLL